MADSDHHRKPHATRGAHDDLSAVFAALADPIRRDLVARLALGDATVSELAEPYEISLQAVSKHLRVLTDAGVVTKTAYAQRRNVSLRPDVFDLMTKWIERYRAEAEARYRRLDAVLTQLDDSENSNPPQDPKPQDPQESSPGEIA